MLTTKNIAEAANIVGKEYPILKIQLFGSYKVVPLYVA